MRQALFCILSSQNMALYGLVWLVLVDFLGKKGRHITYFLPF
ncbi:hypothetical protein Emin_0247 [Elusimicrobium minutum Pei191]|uniref:Uncharacterized protein n=1 Tax=Elusimicrobium minutum (strain Pei191) TaxID=445932 RepID=B2KB50_ELUMP|nr:hypothetical protein Emin_0247 [Elusimicrobium minutum Pei191]